MQVEDLDGVLLFTPKVFGDDRGFFYESWNQQKFLELLQIHGQKVTEFVQDNHSRSCCGVLRGLHYQLPPHAQGKLVRCVVGEILDVAVDIRCNSHTFGKSQTVVLSSQNHKQLWVPTGFAHGFLTLSENAEVLYKTSDFWSRDSERAIRWDDPDLAIAWPLDKLSGIELQLSEKDLRAPFLAEISKAELFS